MGEPESFCKYQSPLESPTERERELGVSFRCGISSAKIYCGMKTIGG